MNCLSQVTSFCSYALEQLGLYEPEIDMTEAKSRLNKEAAMWEKYQYDRAETWKSFLEENTSIRKPWALIDDVIEALKEEGIEKKVAVDLGCGIGDSGTFHLLELGWKVYAIDSSKLVTDSLEEKVSRMAKKWIEKGQLIIVNQPIESFDYPEKVHLIIAEKSLPYCDPRQITKILLKAKFALQSKGCLLFDLLPYNNAKVDQAVREEFGAWITTKNVVEAIMRFVNFSEHSVRDDGKFGPGIKNPICVIAQVI